MAKRFILETVIEMNVYKYLYIFVLLICLVYTAPVFSGVADISGNPSYSISGRTVTLRVDRIMNNTNNIITGSLYLTLRMTQGSSPSTAGYNVARTSISIPDNTTGQLYPGESFVNLVQSATFSPPPNGTYYVHLYVSEYPELNTSLDYVTFPKTYTLTNNSDDSNNPVDSGDDGGDASNNSGVSMSGTVSITWTDSEIRILIDHVINSRNSSTGVLVIEAWMFRQIGDTNGYKVASLNLGSLSANSRISGISEIVDFIRPPDGTYYASVIIQERNSSGEYVVDRKDFTTTETFSSGDDSGGGGQLSYHFIMLLLAIVFLVNLRKILYRFI